MFLVIANDSYRDLSVHRFDTREEAECLYEILCRAAAGDAAGGSNETRVSLIDLDNHRSFRNDSSSVISEKEVDFNGEDWDEDEDDEYDENDDGDWYQR